MFLQKDKIIRLIKNNNLMSRVNFDDIGEISVDLHASYFYSGDEKLAWLTLHSNEGVIVQSHEIIDLPADIMAFVSIRNKWIRQGLILQAPVYQPGHKTNVTFSLYNISGNTVDLMGEDSFAQIMFYQLPYDSKEYTGKYYNEIDMLVGDTFSMYDKNIKSY